FVFKADVGCAPVAAEALGDDAVFVDVGPAGVMQQGRDQDEFPVGLRVGVAEPAGVSHGQREVEVVAACSGFGNDLSPHGIVFVGVGGGINRAGVDGPVGWDGPLGVFVGERRREILKRHGGGLSSAGVLSLLVWFLGDEGFQHG